MTTLTLDPRTNVSGVAELLQIRDQLETLTARRAEVASHIAEDAEFMGGEVLHIPSYDARGIAEAPIGTVYHVSHFESECRPWITTEHDAHRADQCPERRRRFWCGQRQGEKVRVPYTREPKRSWHTFLGSWVLIAYDAETRMGTLVAIQEATA